MAEVTKFFFETFRGSELILSIMVWLLIFAAFVWLLTKLMGGDGKND